MSQINLAPAWPPAPENMAGWSDIENYIVDGPEVFDAVELSGVHNVSEDDSQTWIEQCADSDAEFFSVYLHLKAGGCECAGDFEFKADAERYAGQLERALK